MGSQGFGALPPGAAPFGPRPASPRGLYRQFGMPESLLRIHFPTTDPNNKPSIANPWYWYYDRQQPFAFSFLDGVWGPGWLRLPSFGVIKILAIDSQPIIKFPLVGSTSLLDAVQNKRQQAGASWGRINFSDDHFWALVSNNGVQNQNMPKDKPKFDSVRGQLRARDSKTNLSKLIENAAKQFEANWRADAADYNKAASGVSPRGGFQYQHVHGHFAIGQPSGPPTNLTTFGTELNAFAGAISLPFAPDARYLSALPASACFNFGTFITDATAYTLRVGQLDPKVWNMSVFPPLDSTKIGNGSSSFVSGDYSGFSSPSFPFDNPSN